MRAVVVSHLVVSAVLLGVLAWGASGLALTPPDVGLARASSAWSGAVVVAHLGLLLTLGAAARARVAGAPRAGLAHLAAWGWYAGATLLVGWGYGDAILRFKRDTGLWAGEFNGALFGLLFAWPAALALTGVVYLAAGRWGPRSEG